MNYSEDGCIGNSNVMGAINDCILFGTMKSEEITVYKTYVSFNMLFEGQQLIKEMAYKTLQDYKAGKFII